jgi:hypothetical protein
MLESELKNILYCIDTALGIYRRNEKKLTAHEQSLKKLLSAVRLQIAEQLSRERTASAPNIEPIAEQT